MEIKLEKIWIRFGFEEIGMDGWMRVIEG